MGERPGERENVRLELNGRWVHCLPGMNHSFCISVRADCKDWRGSQRQKEAENGRKPEY